MEEDYAPQARDETVRLELMKTRLQVKENELLRLNRNGSIAMRVKLADIEKLDFRQRLDVAAGIFILIGFGLWLIAHFISENNVLTTILYVAAVLIVGMGLFGIQIQQIVIRTPGGVTHINCEDARDENEGFVASLRNMLQP